MSKEGHKAQQCPLYRATNRTDSSCCSSNRTLQLSSTTSPSTKHIKPSGADQRLAFCASLPSRLQEPPLKKPGPNKTQASHFDPTVCCKFPTSRNKLRKNSEDETRSYHLRPFSCCFSRSPSDGQCSSPAPEQPNNMAHVFPNSSKPTQMAPDRAVLT